MSLHIGIVGCGKIARDQHLPAIARNPGLVAVATADPQARCPDLPGYADLAAMLAAHPEIAAVALCQPPKFRAEAARAALAAGRHVLLEKPPGTTPEEIEPLVAEAGARGLTLFAAWHSREAAAVAPARAWLAGRTIRAIAIAWKEDVRHWHPGQAWIWQRGGFGVFDPGINALSILTALVPEPIALLAARLEAPANREAPIAAQLRMESASGIPVAAELDWRQTGPQSWDIRVETDRGELVLGHGGNAWSLDGAAQPVPAEDEYGALYRRFAKLIAIGGSEVDLAPLRLACDALRVGETVAVEPFVE